MRHHRECLLTGRKPFPPIIGLHRALVWEKIGPANAHQREITLFLIYLWRPISIGSLAWSLGRQMPRLFGKFAFSCVSRPIKAMWQSLSAKKEVGI
ncbi:hypothetical protein ACVWXN_007036 [Bradyrhizobium sp. i1.4.4]